MLFKGVYRIMKNKLITAASNAYWEIAQKQFIKYYILMGKDNCFMTSFCLLTTKWWTISR